MAQLSYTFELDKAMPGLIADLGKHFILSGKADVELPFGTAVSFKSGEEDVLEPITSAAAFAGVAVRDQSFANLNNVDEEGFLAGKNASALREGNIYVQVEDAVVQGGAVFVRITAPGSQVIGSFRSDVDGGNAVALPNAIYLTSADANGFAVLRLNY